MNPDLMRICLHWGFSLSPLIGRLLWLDSDQIVAELTLLGPGWLLRGP